MEAVKETMRVGEKKKNEGKNKKERESNESILISLLKIRFESVKFKIKAHFCKISK